MTQTTTDLAPALKELLAEYRRARGPVHADRLASAVRDLSAMFTGQAPRRAGYFARADWRRAYVEYYLPRYASAVARVLDEMAIYDPEFLDRPLRVLDFGCGPGSASVGFQLRGGRASRLVLVDSSPESFPDAELLLGRTFERAETPPAGPYDLVFAVNVLVELEGPDALAPLLQLLEPHGYLVVVEPAMSGPTRRLMAWRDELVARGWRIAAPCVGAERCPMRSQPDVWCHQDLPWSRPKLVVEIDRRLEAPRERLKFAYLVITREGRDLARLAPWRMVSNLHLERGGAWAWLCGGEGDLWRAELRKRDRCPGKTEFLRADRGDLLKIEGPSRAPLGAEHQLRRI
ncbi:MAG: methyltransferase domain-containing protein [Planctomycetes bacterium]|nr:methyltransferase domain-containing protein [Planctomycetota bacterium]